MLQEENVCVCIVTTLTSHTHFQYSTLLCTLTRMYPCTTHSTGGIYLHSNNVKVWPYGPQRGCMNKILFKEPSICRLFCFSPPPSPRTTRIGIAGSPFISISQPRPFSSNLFVQSLATARKSFRRFRKLSRRSTMTRS
jgi:hypothetical protein